MRVNPTVRQADLGGAAVPELSAEADQYGGRPGAGWGANYSRMDTTDVSVRFQLTTG